MGELKLGPPILYRLAHLGEEPRAFVRLRPNPETVRVPYIMPGNYLEEHSEPAWKWLMMMASPRYGQDVYSFNEAVANGIVKAEDYYDA